MKLINLKNHMKIKLHNISNKLIVKHNLIIRYNQN